MEFVHLAKSSNKVLAHTLVTTLNQPYGALVNTDRLHNPLSIQATPQPDLMLNRPSN